MGPESAQPVQPHAPDERALEASSLRIDRLLAELQDQVSGPAWQRVEELVRELLGLYGAGLSRVLGHAKALLPPEAALGERLAGDRVVSSLLLVHGLHPLPLEERVRRALDRVRPYLGSHAGDIALLGISPEGVVRLRLLGSCQGCPSSAATLEQTVRQAIEEAAPEVAGIEVEGEQPAAGDGLVRLRGPEAPEAP